MLRMGCWAIVVSLGGIVTGLAADPAKCQIKLMTSEAPTELPAAVRALLSDQAVAVTENGQPFCAFWFRKEIPVKASAAELAEGLRYTRLEESTIVGVMQVVKPWSSFRRQVMRPGLYTLRLGFQPMDGDHMGTAPYNEFLLLCPASQDKKADLMPHKELTQFSSKAIPGSTHPAVLLLYPNAKPQAMPELVDKGGGNWVLNWKVDVTAEGKRGTLGVGLTLFGATTAE